MSTDLRAEYKTLVEELLGAHLEREIAVCDENASWASRTDTLDKLNEARSALDAFVDRLLSAQART